MCLTKKQKDFCLEYVRTGKAEEAALAAGYSKKGARNSGTRNLQNDECREYIDGLMEQVESEKIADAKEVLQTLTRILRGEEQDSTLVMKDGEYQTVQVPCKVNERIRAADLLGKRYGLYTERIEVKEEKKTIEVNIVE